MTETAQILAQYKKANKDRKKVILKKFGASTHERFLQLMSNKVDTKDVKLSRTELAALVLNSQGIEMEISFQKQVDKKDVLKQLMDVYEFTAPANVESSFKKCLDKGLNGETRLATVIGNGKTDKFGKLYLVETTVALDKTKSYDNRMILVNLSNLNWAKINGVTYTKKD